MTFYYKEKINKLEKILQVIKEEESKLANNANEQAIKLSLLKKEYEREIDKKFNNLKEFRLVINTLAKERQVGFPWLAKAYEEAFKLYDEKDIHDLRYKKHPALKKSDKVQAHAQARRDAAILAKQNEYIVKFYESVMPELLEWKQLVEIPSQEDIEKYKEFSSEEKNDEVSEYLKPEEYRSLSVVERNQRALDRYWKKKKTPWQIGKMYEQYVGYLYEKDGYKVEYHGIEQKLNDLGIDLICKKKDSVILVQCKYWNQFSKIYEKYIFQLFGAFFQYQTNQSNNIKKENLLFDVESKIKPVFYTSTQLSPVAKQMAELLKIEVQEKKKWEKYPSIKCNISSSGEKIYHLPFDQKYQDTKIDKKGEFYCTTCQEAEEKGFRRARRWLGNKP